MVVKANYVEEISVIDLADSDNECDSINIGPLAGISLPQSTHGTFITANGWLTVCGESRADCYEYDDLSDQWFVAPARSTDRFVPYGVDMDSGHWVSGGEDVGELITSELYDGDSFQDSVDLLLPTRDHCAVRIAENEALVMGGEIEHDLSPTHFIYGTQSHNDLLQVTTTKTVCSGSMLRAARSTS